MASTGKSISTICYNTVEFLQNKLDALVKAKVIERYTYIVHDKDSDPDTGEVKKTHIHLWIKPGKRLDTLVFRDEFNEVDPNNDKPLRCKNFFASDESNFLRYVLHDPLYLELKDKHDDGRVEYAYENLVTNEPEELHDAYIKSAEVLEYPVEKQFFILADYIDQSLYRLTYSDIVTYAQMHGCIKAALTMHQQVRALINDKNMDLQEQEIHNSIGDQMREKNYVIHGLNKRVDELGDVLAEAETSGSSVSGNRVDYLESLNRDLKTHNKRLVDTIRELKKELSEKK